MSDGKPGRSRICGKKPDKGGDNLFFRVRKNGQEDRLAEPHAAKGIQKKISGNASL